MSLKYLGRGCKTCPVREHGHCDTATYRGSRCAELRDEIGLDDPEKVTLVDHTYRGIRCICAQYGISPVHFFFEKDGKGIDFEYEISDGFWPTDELEFVERAIDTFLEQENASEEISKLKEQLEKYKAVFGDILFPAEPGTSRKILPGDGCTRMTVSTGNLSRRTPEKSTSPVLCCASFPTVFLSE